MPRVLAISVPLNFAWEMLQMPAFKGLPESFLATVALCAGAAIEDALVAVAVFGLGVYAFHDHHWFIPPRLHRYAVTVGAGLVVHLVFEWYAVHELGLWTYRAFHPIVPGLGLGIVPILQPIILLPLTFWIVARWAVRPRQSPGSYQ